MLHHRKAWLVFSMICAPEVRKNSWRLSRKITTKPTEVGDVTVVKIIKRDQVVGPVEVGDVVASICKIKSEEGLKRD